MKIVSLQDMLYTSYSIDSDAAFRKHAIVQYYIRLMSFQSCLPLPSPFLLCMVTPLPSDSGRYPSRIAS
jgi:hypothetical protein